MLYQWCSKARWAMRCGTGVLWGVSKHTELGACAMIVCQSRMTDGNSLSNTSSAAKEWPGRIGGVPQWNRLWRKLLHSSASSTAMRCDAPYCALASCAAHRVGAMGYREVMRERVVPRGAVFCVVVQRGAA